MFGKAFPASQDGKQRSKKLATSFLGVRWDGWHVCVCFKKKSKSSLALSMMLFLKRRSRRGARYTVEDSF